MRKTFQTQILATIASALMFILMLPFSSGNGQWAIQNWSCHLVWVFLVPLWLSIRKTKPRQIILFGFVFSFLSSLGTLYWVFTAFRKYGNLSIIISSSIMLAFILAEAVIRNIAFVISSRFTDKRFFPFLAAVVFYSVDLLMYVFPFHGFPWITASHGAFPMTHIIQTIDLFGIQGLNFFVYLVNFLIVESILEYRQNSKLPRKKLGTVLGIWVLFFVYGYVRISQLTHLKNEAPIQVVLVQGNIPQNMKWSQKDRESILESYLELSLLASDSSPDLVVWPEASFPRSLRADTEKLPVQILGPDPKTTFVVGAPTWYYEEKKLLFKNSAFITDHEGNVSDRYDKHQLVPFGEYVPSFFGLPIDKLVPAVAGNFVPGGLDQPLPKANDHLFGLFICYEALFPKIARAWAKQGAEFFVAITNDAWFDLGSGPFQHVQFAGIRSIEFRKATVRAANTGITTWFDSMGRRQESLDLSEKGVLAATISPSTELTLYARMPFLLPLALWITFAIIWIRFKKS